MPSWAPVQEDRQFWHFDSLLGWSHRPLERGLFKHPDFTVEVSNNSFGMRDIEYPVERTAKKRMLVLGDSLGWGFGVELDQRFSEILEKAHPDWEILNTSVSGYGTDQEYLYLKERGIAFRPDVVLLLFAYNDFENNTRGDEYSHFKPVFTLEGETLKLHNDPVPNTPTLSQRIRGFFIRTYLGSRYMVARDRVRRLATQTSGSKYAESETESAESQSVMITQRLIRAINDLCTESGSRFVLVSTPLFGRRRAALETVAGQEEFPLLMLNPFLDSAKSTFTFPHDRHWNATGHEIVAKAIDGFLLQLGIFESPAPDGRPGNPPTSGSVKIGMDAPKTQ